jgi:hypothetical protein
MAFLRCCSAATSAAAASATAAAAASANSPHRQQKLNLNLSLSSNLMYFAILVFLFFRTLRRCYFFFLEKKTEGPTDGKHVSGTLSRTLFWVKIRFEIRSGPYDRIIIFIFNHHV